ncbi:DUF3078 family protein [Algoriphagus boseongensis]|uniref:DUF3078 family protein n=1 Tax=Algoriphagus boseongensis TaxID=1442587 RepID=A0A4R6TB94_9BACT|nr:DUF3078 domain-containing protein [Algoriphagus boseongensis]TDQ19272.1 DUF3078 family protein [Algoriphagus boseongensis]
MKKLFTIFLFIVTIGIASAQDGTEEVKKDTTYWLKEIAGGLNINQASFSGNWTGGGVNSMAFSAYLAGRANYAKDKWSWDNTLDLIYGVVKNQGEDGRKSNDRIYLDSKLGHKISPKWNIYFGVNFLSQFAPGYDFDTEPKSLISKWANPAYLTTGIGFEYKPNDEFLLRLSPFAPRFTFVTDTELYKTVPENYGVEIGKTVRQEWLAFNLLAEWKKEVSDRFGILMRYQMYANLETLAFNSIDHRLDVGFVAKITEAINVSLTTLTIYDLDQDEKVQFSQGLAIGLAFKRGNFPEKK